VCCYCELASVLTLWGRVLAKELLCLAPEGVCLSTNLRPPTDNLTVRVSAHFQASSGAKGLLLLSSHLRTPTEHNPGCAQPCWCFLGAWAAEPTGMGAGAHRGARGVWLGTRKATSWRWGASADSCTCWRRKPAACCRRLAAATTSARFGKLVRLCKPAAWLETPSGCLAAHVCLLSPCCSQLTFVCPPVYLDCRSWLGSLGDGQA